MKRILILMIIGIFTMNISAQTETFCRFEKNGSAFYGKVSNDTVEQLNKAPWFGVEFSGVKYKLSEVHLLNPSEPEKIIGLVKAYKQSWGTKTPPKAVRWFVKPSSSAASDGDTVITPEAFDEVKVECELVIVIGKKIKNADDTEAANAIFGFTVGDDIMGYDESFVKKTGDSDEYKDPSLAAGLKICDKFAPFGPFIRTNMDWKNLNFTLSVLNPDSGKNIIYNDNTKNLIYSPSKIVSDLSKVLTLNPGDVIFSGTSKSFVASGGDLVGAEIEGLCKITNKINAGK